MNRVTHKNWRPRPVSTGCVCCGVTWSSVTVTIDGVYISHTNVHFSSPHLTLIKLYYNHTFFKYYIVPIYLQTSLLTIHIHFVSKISFLLQCAIHLQTYLYFIIDIIKWGTNNEEQKFLFYCNVQYIYKLIF